MQKSHVLRTVFLSTVFALLTVFLMTPVASAHTTALAHRAATVTSQVPHASNVDIITASGRSEFSQSSVDCTFQSGQPCVMITNRTHKPQEIDQEGGSAVATFQPGQAVGIIAPAQGTYRLILAVNNQATLNITAS